MPKVHYCFSQHLNEAMPPRKRVEKRSKNKGGCNCKRCKCREEVSLVRAKQLVESGAAEWLVIGINRVRFKDICPICLNDKLLKKSCSICGKTGEVMKTVFSPIRSNDIVMVTTGSGEPD